jgi:hypothetical protein
MLEMLWQLNGLLTAALFTVSGALLIMSASEESTCDWRAVLQSPDRAQVLRAIQQTAKEDTLRVLRLKATVTVKEEAVRRQASRSRSPRPAFAVICRSCRQPIGVFVVGTARTCGMCGQVNTP